MRVNVEDTVKRHLPRLAKEMGWSVREALGALVMVYNATQQAGIVEDTSARIATVCVLDFDDDAQCERFITAMIAAQLAVMLDNGRVRIRGNEDRIAELNAWYAQKVEAGRRGGLAKARNRKNAMDSVATPSESVANTWRNVPVLSPMSLGSDLHSSLGGGEVISQTSDRPPLPPAEVTERKIKPVDQAHLNLHYGTYCALLKSIRKREAPPRPTKKAGWALEGIANATLGDCGKVLEAFVRTENPYYAKRGWALEVLERDLDEIYQRVKGVSGDSEAQSRAKAAHERAKAASIAAAEAGQ